MSSQRQQAATPTTPHISAHARQRHDERTAGDACCPEREWHRGQRVHGVERLFGCDEVRWHEDDGVLLLRRGAAIKTVLALDRISDEEREAVLGEVGRC